MPGATREYYLTSWGVAEGQTWKNSIMNFELWTENDS